MTSFGQNYQYAIFNASSGHCLAYWLDSGNIDHYQIHMIETIACVVLVFGICLYIQCKKWNMKKLYKLTPPSSVTLDDSTLISTKSIMTNNQPLLNGSNPPTQYNTTNHLPPNSIEIPNKTSDSTLNGDECDSNHKIIQNQEQKTESDHEEEEEEYDEEQGADEWDTATTRFTASSMQTFPFFDESDSENDTNHRSAWNIFSKLNLFNFKQSKKKKYKKKYGIYPKSLTKKSKKSGKDPILLPSFMKIIYLFFGGVTFKFILSSHFTFDYYDLDNVMITILNSIVSFLDNLLWFSLCFLLIQKSSSKRAFLRAFGCGILFGLILCSLYGKAYYLGEPFAWNLPSILLLFYYGIRVFVCIVIIAFMHTKRYNHNRWKRWKALRFLIVYLLIINIAYVLSVISMSLNNCESHSAQILNIGAAKTAAAALLDVCWFTLVELVRNLTQPFILYGTLLKDTNYWRQLAKAITMSSAIDVPRRGGTLDLSIENYRDIEAFARITRVPVLDFADFELKSPIGRGATASVYRADFRGYPVACKDLAANLIDEISYESVHRFCREALLFIHIQHINIIKFFGICLRPPALYLVFELATHGTLRNLLDSSARKRKRGLCAYVN